jgi:hypothetical protein
VAGPVERKVQASTGAAAESGLALWALGHYVFRTGVPDVVASWIYVIVPGLLTFGAGYLAKHTPRPAAPAPVLPSNVTLTASRALTDGGFSHETQPAKDTADG